MKQSLLVIAFGVLAAHSYGADESKYKLFVEGYGDAVYSGLTGFSTYQIGRAGIRWQNWDALVYGKNEVYDTRGGNVPFNSSGEGIGVGVELRHWIPSRRGYLFVSEGTILSGNNKKRNDFRAGAIVFNYWEFKKQFADLYGELVYVQLAEDTVASVRYRQGPILKSAPGERLWWYGVGQAWGSGKGTSGTENRIEAGLGIGYVFKSNWTINAELRAGLSYRGTISDRTYLNPTIILAGSF